LHAFKHHTFSTIDDLTNLHQMGRYFTLDQLRHLKLEVSAHSRLFGLLVGILFGTIANHALTCLGPPPLHGMGEGPPLGCRSPHTLASREGWLHYHLWGGVGGRDEVRTFDAWCWLEMFKMLSQIAN
jgi:hypothetical protein